MRIVYIRPLLAGLLLLIPALGWGHAFAPHLIQLTEQQPGTIALLWKQPTGQGANPNWRPQLTLAPECHLTWGTQLPDTQAVLHYGRWQCPQPLNAQQLTIANLIGSQQTLIVRYQTHAGDAGTATLSDARQTLAFTPSDAASLQYGLWHYLPLGVEHILFGIDHLLFVFCLWLLVPTLRALLWAVSGFTLAHSLTLGLAALELLRVPSAPVEALIALSIVLMAASIVEGKKLQSVRSLCSITICFGLLHGLGFAGALEEIGLPQDQQLPALLLFNLGVELGQFAFIGALSILAWGVNRGPIPAFAMKLRHLCSLAAGGVSAFWFLQRVVLVLT